VITARHRNIALLVAGCYFMEMLDGTIVTTASPQIGRSLRAPATEVGLVVTAYLLTLAVLIPLSGWLTRRYGNRVVFLTAIVLFTLASVGCAASVNLGMLVAMRVLQGAGGAMMVPVGRTMVLSPAAKEDILRASGATLRAKGDVGLASDAPIRLDTDLRAEHAVHGRGVFAMSASNLSSRAFNSSFSASNF